VGPARSQPPPGAFTQAFRLAVVLEYEDATTVITFVALPV
jgi:hypothetical protein